MHYVIGTMYSDKNKLPRKISPPVMNNRTDPNPKIKQKGFSLICHSKVKNIISSVCQAKPPDLVQSVLPIYF